MASQTPNLNLRKPTNQDLVNVTTDLAANFDAIDAHVTSPTAHSGTYVPYTLGAVGDGVADNTAVFQAALDAGVLSLPAGTFKITSKLNWTEHYAHLIGSGRDKTVIVQATDNAPILDIGPGEAQINTFHIEGVSFDYSNSQAAANTSAIPLKFSAEAYQGIVRDIEFRKGAYAIEVASGIGCPWGTSWDDLWFQGALSRGAINFANGINAVPHNKFGRMYVTATAMDSIIFNMRGYNMVVEAVEINNVVNGNKLWQHDSEGMVEIGAFKLETCTYTAATILLDFLANCHAHIGQLSIGGLTSVFTPSSGRVALANIGAGGGTSGNLQIDYIRAKASSLTGTVVAVSGSGRIEVGNVRLENGWRLNDYGSSTTPEITTVRHHANRRLSADKGDANYTIALGDPCIVSFETPLTTQRTVQLPAVDNDLFNGLSYTIRSAGAVNGANTILVKSGATTMATLTHDNASITLTHRRNASVPRDGWRVSSHEDSTTTAHGIADTANLVLTDDLAALVPQAGAHLWIPAITLHPEGGASAPNIDVIAGRWTARMYDASAVEITGRTLDTPSWWTTFHVDLWWSNNGAGAGDVVWRADHQFRADTQALGSGEVVGSNTTITAPAQSVLKVSRILTSLSATASALFNLRTRRVANDAADTLANDAALLGIMLVRAS